MELTLHVKRCGLVTVTTFTSNMDKTLAPRFPIQVTCSTCNGQRTINCKPHKRKEWTCKVCNIEYRISYGEVDRLLIDTQLLKKAATSIRQSSRPGKDTGIPRRPRTPKPSAYLKISKRGKKKGTNVKKRSYFYQ